MMGQFLIKAFRSIYFRFFLDHSQSVGEAQYPKGAVLDLESGNALLKQMIESGRPFMAGRFGTELKALRNYMEIEIHKQGGLKKLLAGIKGFSHDWNPQIKQQLKDLTGVFPATDEMMHRFSVLYNKHIKNIDILGVWYFLKHEYSTIHQCRPQAKLIPALSLEPFRFKVPWSSALANKKVLIVHPFAKSIQRQYKQRDLIFPGRNVLPEFELKLLKAVQSLGGENTEFSNWVEAYDYMCNEIQKQDFDVAIIGAGAYGLPLASFVKQLGKQAIQMGGATQLLFGIKGKRWDENGFGDEFYNDSWIRPAEEERPLYAEAVEGACYW